MHHHGAFSPENSLNSVTKQSQTVTHRYTLLQSVSSSTRPDSVRVRHFEEVLMNKFQRAKVLAGSKQWLAAARAMHITFDSPVYRWNSSRAAKIKIPSKAGLEAFRQGLDACIVADFSEDNYQF